MLSPIQINVRHESENCVVQVRGDIDLSSSPRLRETLLELIREQGEKKVVLNLEHVDYIDSSGIASLIEGLKLAKGHDARFMLAGLNEGPRYVLQLTRLLDVFEVHPSESDALKA